MTDTLTRLERDDGRAAAWIVLDRPAKKNALSIAVRDEISAHLAALAEDEAVKCVVVTGVGDTFSAGFDLGEFAAAAGDEELSRRLWASSDLYHRALLTFPLPMVAAVNGPAIAGGFDLAVCCDLRIASDRARFAHPEYSFGDVVYSPLHDLVGGAVARELCFTGRSLSADEALALRVVNDVVPPDALVERVRDLTATIAAAPREQLRRTKAKALARARLVHGATLDL